MEVAGHRSLDDLVVVGDWAAASGEAGLHELLRRGSGIDAVFASNDQMALGVLHAAHRLGLRVPEDHSVVGVDDIAESPHFWPPLTTVHQPLRDAGMLAVETVVRAIRPLGRGPRADEPVTAARLLEPELVVRESSRPVPTAVAHR